VARDEWKGDAAKAVPAERQIAAAIPAKRALRVNSEIPPIVPWLESANTARGPSVPEPPRLS